mmetsp:Transcript_35866/g.112175  ORF Transcript_35866/g.112175 Transcript_35866/m.112175 type:complete len:213 (+) Transcript_35866:228-866(+)
MTSTSYIFKAFMLDSSINLLALHHLPSSACSRPLALSSQLRGVAVILALATKLRNQRLQSRDSRLPSLHALCILNSLVLSATRHRTAAEVLGLLGLVNLNLRQHELLDAFQAVDIPGLDLFGPLLILVHVVLVISVVTNKLLVLKGRDYVGDLTHEVSIVRDDQQGAVVELERFFQHLLGWNVQVVGWLVQHKKVGRSKHHPAEGNASFLST